MAKKNVWICLGDIFEGGAHLTVLPASAKGTISSSCRRWVNLFDLAAPPFDKGVALGELSSIFPFPKPSVSEHYCYAYSVFNDRSTSEALAGIGRALGQITQEDSSIRVIQSPLLGTGAGGLSNDDAAKALIAGFVEASHPNALLCIFVSDSERHKNLQKHLKSALSQFLDGISIEVSFMGVGFKFDCVIHFAAPNRSTDIEAESARWLVRSAGAKTGSSPARVAVPGECPRGR